ncbi:uncharacterized protein HMPREF1541_05176 [Cyphellophora europaea CBS 101466]|uniref:Thioesterase domain-containing protein n=1 Tax=Cyphellophora europaea (strain CBS 101466) TaxID=1220924 RepID=W2RWP8_CYPE1|nr:uncharacterized protein HMPREF1541_05176 [Cyphellophora europaea CBS 101466]ETN40896.1 hypothetical protein HMPREF1541_05176 [Cyphellophora europaea CBS 101466]
MGPSSRRYGPEFLEIPGIKNDFRIADPKARIAEYLKFYQRSDSASHFESALMRDIQILSATGPPNTTSVFELEMTPTYCSRMGNAHGGAVSLIFDMCTSMCIAPVARQGFWEFGGVSRTLNVTYMRPVRQGITVLIECEVLQVGKRLAMIRGLMKDKADGRVLCSCEHDKASIEFPETKL